MSTNELRIGNWIDTKDFHFDKFKGLYQYDPEWYKYVHMFEPIPLTEEWLLKFGFRMEKGADFFYCKRTKMPNVTLEVNLNFRVILFDRKRKVFTDIKYTKYVHQLQNLYFALTGEELKLNENL